MKFHPTSNEAIALVLREAGENGEKVAVEGYGSWSKTEADISVSTDRFNTITDLADRDLTVSAGAGVTLKQLRKELDRFGVWTPSDPPGGDRSLGSIMSTEASGPSAASVGPLMAQ